MNLLNLNHSGRTTYCCKICFHLYSSVKQKRFVCECVSKKLRPYWWPRHSHWFYGEETSVFYVSFKHLKNLQEPLWSITSNSQTTCLTLYSWRTQFGSSKDCCGLLLVCLFCCCFFCCLGGFLFACFLVWFGLGFFGFSHTNRNNSFDRLFFNLNGENGSSFVISFPENKMLTNILMFILKMTFDLWFASTYLWSELFMEMQMWPLSHVFSYYNSETTLSFLYAKRNVWSDLPDEIK